MATPSHIAVPRTVDDVPLIIGIRLDDMIIFLAAFMLGFLFRQLLACAALGFVLVWLHRKYVIGRARSHLQHVCYWNGLYPERGRSFRNAFVRQFTS